MERKILGCSQLCFALSFTLEIFQLKNKSKTKIHLAQLLFLRITLYGINASTTLMDCFPYTVSSQQYKGLWYIFMFGISSKQK